MKRKTLRGATQSVINKHISAKMGVLYRLSSLKLLYHILLKNKSYNVVTKIKKPSATNTKLK